MLGKHLTPLRLKHPASVMEHSGVALLLSERRYWIEHLSDLNAAAASLARNVDSLVYAPISILYGLIGHSIWTTPPTAPHHIVTKQLDRRQRWSMSLYTYLYIVYTSLSTRYAMHSSTHIHQSATKLFPICCFTLWRSLRWKFEMH